MASPQPAIQIFSAIANATFTGNIFLDGWDIHIRKNRAGTTTEFV